MNQKATLYEFIEYAEGGERRSLWDLLEAVPAKYDALIDLHSWSMNYDHSAPNHPWLMFLDLVGFSIEEYGEHLSRFHEQTECGFGWVELDKLAQALTLWSDCPQECESVVRCLIGADPFG